MAGGMGTRCLDLLLGCVLWGRTSHTVVEADYVFLVRDHTAGFGWVVVLVFVILVAQIPGDDI